MMMGRSDEIDLLLPLHEGLYEEPVWGTFLGRLRRRLRADGAAIILAKPDGHLHHNFDINVFSSEMDHAEKLFDIRRYLELRPVRIYCAQEIGEASSYLRMARINNPDGGLIAWAMVFREREDFAAADGALLSALVPHIGVALRNLAARQALEQRGGVSDDALARMAAGWIMFDGEARIIDASQGAAQTLRQHFSMTRLPGERLHVSVEASRQLATLAAAFAADRDTPSQAIILSDTPRIDMLVTRPKEEGATAMIGFLRRPDPLCLSPAVVAQLFGLPLSEARLAIALAGGSTIAEAAIGLGLTLETARNYSKKLYAKTGAKGQVDLVRLILTGAAAFG